MGQQPLVGPKASSVSRFHHHTFRSKSLIFWVRQIFNPPPNGATAPSGPKASSVSRFYHYTFRSKCLIFWVRQIFNPPPPMGQQPLVSPRPLLSIEALPSHYSDTSQSGGLSSGQVISPTQNLYLTTNNTHRRQTIHAPGGIRTHNPSKRAAAHLRLRPRGNWDRLFLNY